MESVPQRDQTFVPQELWLEVITGRKRVSRLVVKGPLQLPGLPEVFGAGDISRLVCRFKSPTHDKKSEQFTGGKLRHTGEITVPASGLGIWVLVDKMVLDLLDHWVSP